MSNELKAKIEACIPPASDDTARRDFCQYAHNAIVKVISEKAEGDRDVTIAGLGVLFADATLRINRK